MLQIHAAAPRATISGILLKKKNSETSQFFPTRRENEEVIGTKQEIQARTREILLGKLSLIERRLADLPRDTLSICLGSEDFLEGAAIYSNSCMDMEAAYSLFSNEFAQLSARYPDVLICPGSTYISSEIPIHHTNKFLQEVSEQFHLARTTCYVSNIMPVYHGGKLVRIIRKGEFIEQLQPGKGKKSSAAVHIPIHDITTLNPNGGKLLVTSFHEDSLTSDLHGQGKKSCCYLGKTLLPGEAALLKRYFPDISLEELTNHSFDLNDQKFVFIICGEFRKEDYTPGTSAEALKEAISSATKPPIVLHSTVGGDVETSLLPGTIYLHADQESSTKAAVIPFMENNIPTSLAASDLILPLTLLRSDSLDAMEGADNYIDLEARGFSV